MFQALRAGARQLHHEARQRWYGLRRANAIRAEVNSLFDHGPFLCREPSALTACLREFYREVLGLPTPEVVVVDSLQQARRVFGPGPRLSPLAALKLESLHLGSATLSTEVRHWRERVERVWALPRAHLGHVELALWGQTLGLASASAPRWLYHFRTAQGGLFEQQAGRLVECGLWCAWLQLDRVVALKAPTALRVDHQGFLHSRGLGASLEWADGQRFWAFHGKALPEDFDPVHLTLEALKGMDLALREAYLDVLGLEWLLERAECRLIDFDLESGGLPRRLVGLTMPEEEVVVVVVQCPSTGKSSILRVPPTMRTCHQAVAWTFGMEVAEDYKPWQET